MPTAGETATAIPAAGSPTPALALLSIPGASTAPERSNCTSVPVSDVGDGTQTRALWFGDGVNEPHMSISKPGALQTRSSFVHTKARLAAPLPSRVHSRILNAL